MIVKVNWDTDGNSLEELGLPTNVEVPTMPSSLIADYLSDTYGFLVESFIVVQNMTDAQLLDWAKELKNKYNQSSYEELSILADDMADFIDEFINKHEY
jgi:hypothetical protein